MQIEKVKSKERSRIHRKILLFIILGLLYIQCNQKNSVPFSIPQSPYISKISKPILKPRGNDFERDKVYNPAVIVDRDTIRMIYRAEGLGTGAGVLGLAESVDGINFIRYLENPVFKSEYEFESGGCEDPRIIKFNDLFYMFYNANDQGLTPGNLCLATSNNLIDWEKCGEILQPQSDWESGQIKAAAPVSQKIDGKYWIFYQGEKEAWKPRIGIASSLDLIHWTQAAISPVLTPREGYFDSWGVEPGVAVVVDEGIFLIYAGWGGDEFHRNQLGWALFDKTDISQLIARCDSPIISKPEDHVFCDGLIQFENKWYIYYGVADEWIEGSIIDIEKILQEHIKR